MGIFCYFVALIQALCIGNFLFAGIGCVDYVVSVLEILCLGIFCYFVVWILCTLYWEFFVCMNWLCGLCGLYWEFSVCRNLLSGLCGLCNLCGKVFMFCC